MKRYGLILFWIIQNNCMAQHIQPDKLFGRWKVKDWLFFERVTETPAEHDTRMHDYNICIKAYVVIDSNGLKILGNACNFYPCNYKFARNARFIKKTVIADNDYTKKESGSEMIDSNIVGRKFVQLLDKNYSKPKLLLLDAGCRQSYGDFTMKICIANKNKIGLFMGEEMIILERMKKRKNVN